MNADDVCTCGEPLHGIAPLDDQLVEHGRWLSYVAMLIAVLAIAAFALCTAHVGP